MAKTKTTVTIAIDPELLKRIDKLAKAMAVSRSRFFELSMREHLADQELGIQAFTDPAIMGPMIKLLGNRDWLRAAAKAFGEEASDEQLTLFSRAAEDLARKAEKRTKKR